VEILQSKAAASIFECDVCFGITKLTHNANFAHRIYIAHNNNKGTSGMM